MHGNNEISIKEENDPFLQLDEVKEEPTTNDEMVLFEEDNDPLDVSYEFVEYNEEPSSPDQHAALDNIHAQGDGAALPPEDHMMKGPSDWGDE